MSGNGQVRARGRASLLATSMLATSVLAVVGGIAGGALLAPGVAVAQTCTDPTTVTPGDPPVTTGVGGSSVTINCGPGNFTGIGFQSQGPTGADVTLNVLGPGAVTGGGILLDDNNNAANLTVVLGNAMAAGPTVTSSGTGVAVVSTGGNVVITDGNLALGGETITGANDGVFATTSAGNTTVTLAGTAGNASTPAIGFTQDFGNTTATVAIGAGATVQNNVGGAAGLAIAAFTTGFGNSTGSVVVNDSGALIGDVNFGLLTPTVGDVSNVMINVLARGVWTTSGSDVFGVGNATTNDTLNIAGKVETTAPTVFQFGDAAGGSNAINISTDGDLQIDRTLLIKDPPVTLTNAGLLDLSTGPAGAISLNGPTTNFVGVAGGAIKTAADLSAPGSLANTLNVATTSGTNDVVIVDSGGAGSHVTAANPIVLVTTTGANNATFTLTGGPGFATFGHGAAGLVKGPWIYTLENLANETVLVSQPGPAADQAPVLVTAAQDIWYATAPWQDRQADFRDASLLAPGSADSFTPGMWVKAVGDWASRTVHADPSGFTFNLGYHQDTYGLVGGVDVARQVASGVGLAGVAAGYLHSNVSFDSHLGNVSDGRFEGWTMSAYATYIRDQFFIDGQIKGDFLQLHLTGGSNNWTSWGGQVESGYRFPLGSMTLEPVGTLAAVSTNVGDANVAGTTLHYASEDSFRGALGLRLSAPLMSNDSYMVKLAVDGRLWDEFDGTNKATLISSGPTAEVQDNFSGAFGEVGGALNIYSHDGHSSGFITGSYKFKSDYGEGKVAVGYRYQWGAPPPPPPPPAAAP